MKWWLFPLALLLLPACAPDGAVDPLEPQMGRAGLLPEAEYQFHSGTPGWTWEQAKTAAEAIGADWHLVVITTAAENEHIHETMPGPGACWIGLYQKGGKEPAGGWRWVNRERVSYLNWSPGEPDNNNGADSAVMSHATGMWGDAPRGQHFQCFVAERNY
jgi:hypothetical protein